jgi:hypothetical protein
MSIEFRRTLQLRRPSFLAPRCKGSTGTAASDPIPRQNWCSPVPASAVDPFPRIRASLGAACGRRQTGRQPPGSASSPGIGPCSRSRCSAIAAAGVRFGRRGALCRVGPALFPPARPCIAREETPVRAFRPSALGAFRALGHALGRPIALYRVPLCAPMSPIPPMRVPLRRWRNPVPAFRTDRGKGDSSALASSL